MAGIELSSERLCILADSFLEQLSEVAAEVAGRVWLKPLRSTRLKGH